MLFRKKQKKENGVPGGSELKSKVANRLAGILSGIQNRFAGIMGSWVNGLTQRGKKIFLIFFSLVFGCYSLSILLNTFIRGNKESSKSIKPTSISIPKYLNKSGDENTFASVIVTQEDLRK